MENEGSISCFYYFIWCCKGIICVLAHDYSMLHFPSCILLPCFIELPIVSDPQALHSLSLFEKVSPTTSIKLTFSLSNLSLGISTF